MPHFIIDSKCVNNDYIIISDPELYNHIVKSLRIKPGENLLLIDENEIQYEGIVNEITKKSLNIKILKSYKSQRKLEINLNIAQCVLKPDAQFSAIQKATELGVKGIIPILSDNCTVKEEIIEKKHEKWQKIALESVKQCERADIPLIYPHQRLQDILEEKEFDIIIAFTESQNNYTMTEFMKEKRISKSHSIVVIIGPEGGFSRREFELFEKYNIPKLTLGNLIYRADTAVAAALTTVINGIQNGQC